VTIERKIQVDGYRWTGSEWIVSCTRMEEKGGNLVATDDKFEIHAEHVVTATGNHAQRTARLLGIKTPAIPVEHQYIVTEPDPMLVEWRKTNPQHPVLRDADAKWYVREERGGWILGPYEKGAPARFEYGVPDSFRADLFPLDLERIEQEYMSFIHRIPVVGNRGPEGRFQRPDLLYPRRQPAGRPRAGPAQHVAGRRVQLRHHRRGRHRPLPGPADDRRRGRDRHGLARPQALRQLDDHRICRAQERGMLRPRLHPAPPGRGTRSLPPAAHRARL
jgi:hypothetical protein